MQVPLTKGVNYHDPELKQNLVDHTVKSTYQTN